MKKYHDIKCENCKTLINVDEYMKNKDYDKIDDKCIFYCPVCGCQTKPKEI